MNLGAIEFNHDYRSNPALWRKTAEETLKKLGMSAKYLEDYDPHYVHVLVFAALLKRIEALENQLRKD